MACYEPAKFRDALFELPHLKGDEAAFTPGDIVVRLQFQITVPRRGRIVQRAQIAGCQSELPLDVGPLRGEARRLRKKSDGGLGAVIGLVYARQVIDCVDALRLLPQRRLQSFARPLVVAGMPCRQAQIHQDVKVRGRTGERLGKERLGLFKFSRIGQRHTDRKTLSRNSLDAANQREPRLISLGSLSGKVQRFQAQRSKIGRVLLVPRSGA